MRNREDDGPEKIGVAFDVLPFVPHQAEATSEVVSVAPGYLGVILDEPERPGLPHRRKRDNNETRGLPYNLFCRHVVEMLSRDPISSRVLRLTIASSLLDHQPTLRL